MIRLLILAVFIFPALVHAAGIEVAPSNLELYVQNNEAVTAELIVTNPTADVQIFEVFADEFGDSIELQPESFTLESGGRKAVIVKLVDGPVGSTSVVLQTNISVVAKPLAETRFQAGTGVKIPTTILVSEGESPTRLEIPDLVLWLSTAGLAILAVLFGTKRPPV